MKPLCCLLLVLVLAACSPNQDPNQLTLGGPFEFTSQDPSRDGYLYTRLQVAQTLVEVDDEGRLLPGLAERWQTHEEGLLWRFQLREGVRFHDGSPLDAEAAAQAVRQALAKPGVIRAAPIAEVIAEGPSSLAIRLTSPYSPLGAVMAHYTTAILAPASYDARGQVRWMLGTGPYRLAEFDPPHRLGVVRFDGYWGKPANIERAVYLTGHRAESRALQVMAGQTDIIYTLDPASLDLLRRRDDVRVHSDTVPRTIQIKLDASHPFLAERDAREALSLALDREGIASRILRVPGGEANQLIPPSLSLWHLDALPPIGRDLSRARALLAGLGWRAGGDGILQRDGQRFAMSLVTYADRPELFVVATAIQAQLREIGVALDVSVVNSSGIPSGHHDGSLQLALVARNYGNVADPLSLLQADYGDRGNGDWGAMGWHNEELPALLRALQAEPDPARYRQGARRVAQILAEELPVIPVLFYTQQTAVSARVRGFSFDPYERNYRIADMSFAP
ncbi:ABC transporter substrate-binding protein [Stutzerimonas nosocomialis]|uniref:ABC transporter substrate-binding protein n=1 Tax=Stutzerimonas nosocomialis TaxID=1056496 RepID=A0A5R9QBN6_9GAMM|nr:ABC transporter substrate-binding protein [Stutzerimonas nosocomialis]TLX59117.1 ABC transporter substrate-binding protein [Stutzerimonas nosocomialis]TLX62511.1 ABC transporter substrate-binding protein [Stutzerimonas nosocomialis]